MPKFRYILTLGLEVEAENYDEAYDLFQEMPIKEAFWNNSNTGVYEVDSDGNELPYKEYQSDETN